MTNKSVWSEEGGMGQNLLGVSKQWKTLQERTGKESAWRGRREYCRRKGRLITQGPGVTKDLLGGGSFSMMEETGATF